MAWQKPKSDICFAKVNLSHSAKLKSSARRKTVNAWLCHEQLLDGRTCLGGCQFPPFCLPCTHHISRPHSQGQLETSNILMDFSSSGSLLPTEPFPRPAATALPATSLRERDTARCWVSASSLGGWMWCLGLLPCSISASFSCCTHIFLALQQNPIPD